MKYVKGLDSIRAFAILLVIIEHWWIPIPLTPNSNLYFWMTGLVPNGSFGVTLFFVLSGYLITSILLNATQKEGEGGFKIIKNFIIRRALRIFPIYYVTIIILYFINYPSIQENIYWLISYTSNILSFTTKSWNHFSHTWTLSVEEQFYLIWPWFIVFVKRKYLKYVFMVAIAVGVLTTVYTMKIQQNWAGFVLMPSCMQAFGLGGLYAFIMNTDKKRIFIRVINILFPIALIFHFIWSFMGEASSEYSYCFLTVNSIISIWIIHKALTNKSEWARKWILENSILNKIGQISYGLYLYHYALTPIYNKIIKSIFGEEQDISVFLLDWQYSYFIRLALLAGLSLLSFHFLEKPVMKLKDRFNY